MKFTKLKYATNYLSCLEEFVKSKFMDLKENQNHHILLFSYLLSFFTFHLNVTNNQKENNECCYSPEVELGGGRVRRNPPIAIFGIQPGQNQSCKKNYWIKACFRLCGDKQHNLVTEKFHLRWR